MPYASGETPMVGDYVKKKWERPGTVTRVHEARDGECKEHRQSRYAFRKSHPLCSLPYI